MLFLQNENHDLLQQMLNAEGNYETKKESNGAYSSSSYGVSTSCKYILFALAVHYIGKAYFVEL